MKHTGILLVDDALRPVAPGQLGELCLSGAQLTPGYWNNPEKNREAFFSYEGRVHYRTGDLCVEDDQGDVMYAGRLDHQVKIQGFRVELSEIEHHAREITGSQHVAAVACPDAAGNTAVHLYLEGYGGEIAAMLEQLRTKVPAYMIPSRTTSLDALPLNANGKIDRPALVRRGL
jgi:acyl-coenzyme A synthetase/AMP-(fatty) acid ligase